MLSERVKTLYDSLSLSGKEVAAAAGVSASAVSVLKSGKKTPPKDGSFMSKYADAVLELSRERGSFDALKNLINAGSDADIKDKLLDWLYDAPRRSGISGNDLRRKIGVLMLKLGISNVSLAREMNVDPSVVSRMKNGDRGSVISPELTLALCRITAVETVNDRNKLAIASDVLHQDLSPEMDEAAIEKAVYDWILADQNENNRSIHSILSAVTSYELLNPSAPAFTSEELIRLSRGEKLIKDDRAYYFGIQGMRDAVIRFLCTAVNETPRELCLFSNQGMEWMLLNPEFFNKWAALMKECVSSGIRIRIIHHINRSVPEMMSAINSWLPLYVTGMVEPFYIDRLPPAHPVFSNTIFLAPGLACISAGHPSGSDDQAIYRYDTDSALLSAHLKVFRSLLNQSKRLINISRDISGMDTSGFIFPSGFSGNIGLHADGRSATVIKASLPQLSITFYHPQLRRAFSAFIKSLD